MFILLILVDKIKRASVTGKLKVQHLNFLPYELPGNLTDWVKSLKIKGMASFKLTKLGYLWLLLS